MRVGFDNGHCPHQSVHVSKGKKAICVLQRQRSVHSSRWPTCICFEKNLLQHAYVCILCTYLLFRPSALLSGKQMLGGRGHACLPLHSKASNTSPFHSLSLHCLLFAAFRLAGGQDQAAGDRQPSQGEGVRRAEWWCPAVLLWLLLYRL